MSEQSSREVISEGGTRTRSSENTGDRERHRTDSEMSDRERSSPTLIESGLKNLIGGRDSNYPLISGINGKYFHLLIAPRASPSLTNGPKGRTDERFHCKRYAAALPNRRSSRLIDLGGARR